MCWKLYGALIRIVEGFRPITEFLISSLLRDLLDINIKNN